MITAIIDIDRRTALCKSYGFKYVIEYNGGKTACSSRLCTKTWALGKLGEPAALIFDGPGNPGVSRVINLDGDWYTGFKSGKKDIYIIEFKKKRLRDFAVLL